MKKRIIILATSIILVITAFIIIFIYKSNKADSADNGNKPKITRQMKKDLEEMGAIPADSENFDEERNKNISKTDEEQAQLDKEKESTLFKFNNTVSSNTTLSDEESSRRIDIWDNIYETEAWKKYVETQYYSEYITWDYVDKGDYISITGINNNMLIEIAYSIEDSKTLVSIIITNYDTMQEIVRID